MRKHKRYLSIVLCCEGAYYELRLKPFVGLKLSAIFRRIQFKLVGESKAKEIAMQFSEELCRNACPSEEVSREKIKSHVLKKPKHVRHVVAVVVSAQMIEMLRAQGMLCYLELEEKYHDKLPLLLGIMSDKYRYPQTS